MNRDTDQPLLLKGVQLAYARAIAAIELRFHQPSREWSENYDEEESAYAKSQAIVHQLETDGDLRRMGQYGDWRRRVPLIDLYDFSENEKALLLDLAEAGGVQITRKHDTRYRGLGSGNGGKGAVMESAQARWKVELSKRGYALVEALRAEAPAA